MNDTIALVIKTIGVLLIGGRLELYLQQMDLTPQLCVAKQDVYEIDPGDLHSKIVPKKGK